jgi:DNA-binding transcriptional LysR family regulator
VELRHLRYFVAVAEEGTVTGAAARLFVAQPSLSRQLRALERHVGAPLLVRTSRGVALTPEGEHLLPVARHLVAQAAALAGLFDAPRTPGARLRVGLHDGAFGPLTEPVLAAFRAARPDVDLRVRPVLWSELDTCLQVGTLDALLTVAGSTDPVTTRFDGLFTDAMCGVLPVASPLADAPVLAVADVLGLPVVEAGPAPARRATPFLLLDHRNGEAPRPVRGVSAPALRRDVIAQVRNRGAFVAVPARGTLEPSPGVRYVPLADAARLPAGVAVARREGTEPDAVVAFRRVARATTDALVGLLPDARPAPRS